MKVILTSILLFFTSLIHAADNINLTVSTTKAQFLVTLPANPSTGYEWTLIGYDKALVNLVDSEYRPPANGLIGAGGTMIFTFAINPVSSFPPTTELIFKYARPWEHQKGSLQKVEINFRVPKTAAPSS